MTPDLPNQHVQGQDVKRHNFDKRIFIMNFFWYLKVPKCSRNERENRMWFENSNERNDITAIINVINQTKQLTIVAVLKIKFNVPLGTPSSAGESFSLQ